MYLSDRAQNGDKMEAGKKIRRVLMAVILAAALGAGALGRPLPSYGKEKKPLTLFLTPHLIGAPPALPMPGTAPGK